MLSEPSVKKLHFQLFAYFREPQLYYIYNHTLCRSAATANLLFSTILIYQGCFVLQQREYETEVMQNIVLV